MLDGETYEEGFDRGIVAGDYMTNAQISAAILDMVVWTRQKIDALKDPDYALGYIAGLAQRINL